MLLESLRINWLELRTYLLKLYECATEYYAERALDEMRALDSTIFNRRAPSAGQEFVYGNK